MSFYLATLWIGVWIRVPFQWIGLASACCATVATIALWHHGRWNVGLRGAPLVAARELGGGILVAVTIIAAADALIVLFTPLHHLRGRGFPWIETVAVFVPAALNEELVFRGYPYQLLRTWRPRFAMVASSLVFAALHAGNSNITALALVNIFLGGIILVLAYERHRRLWMPIGLHFAWNLMSGPVLGYGVSGFEMNRSLFVTIVTGTPLLTGGRFGIEGSLFMTGMEVVAVFVLWRRGMFNVQC